MHAHNILDAIVVIYNNDSFHALLYCWIHLATLPDIVTGRGRSVRKLKVRIVKTLADSLNNMLLNRNLVQYTVKRRDVENYIFIKYE